MWGYYTVEEVALGMNGAGWVEEEADGGARSHSSLADWGFSTLTSGDIGLHTYPELSNMLSSSFSFPLLKSFKSQ